ncbi:hypothetical protein PF010_g26779 [Phytophthora fragariae]|uniref:Uncharacterized protein n=1 Tax=Phytophthora fragariae TaxID=53985 RepID=A0A6A3QT67_9STRA|nr:hypothetical protein PF010_g26779 [Phytophthora fragariae]KAE9082808.1 hypothetical protein PF006_g26822 [Phytophthora fragariae]
MSAGSPRRGAAVGPALCLARRPRPRREPSVCTAAAALSKHCSGVVTATLSLTISDDGEGGGESGNVCRAKPMLDV